MRVSNAIGKATDRLGLRRNGPFRASDYWSKRFIQMQDSIRSVGNSTLTDEQNEVDYAARWDEISASLGELVPDPHGHTLLDAGCGIGLFSRRYEQAGYSVVGFDIAPEAAATAAKRCEGEFFSGTLSEVQLDQTFSVVACHGVLICIVDDREWRTALLNLVRHVEPGGFLLIQEPMGPHDREPETLPHLRMRSPQQFDTLLASTGLEIVVDRGFSLPNEPLPQRLIIARSRETI